MVPDKCGRDLNLIWGLMPLVICGLNLEDFVPEDEEKGFFSPQQES